MKINYEWLTTYFDDGVLPSADELAELLIFHAYEVEGVEEVDGATILDVDVLPNRSSDSLAHRGIAREIATLLNVSLKEDPLREECTLTPETEHVTVTLADDASCSLYVAAYMTGVTVGPSPSWLKERLEAIGQKSINNVVDATNYVTFGLGKPTHVFDAQKFDGENIAIGVRTARAGESLTLLGGDTVELNDTMSVIVDAHADTPLAVAGIKGGTPAEVDDTTVDIVIESAIFNPLDTRLTAQALKLRTDASARFENDVPEPLAGIGAQEVVRIILDIAGGELVGYAQTGQVTREPQPVVVEAAHARALLGVDIATDDMESILTRVGCHVARTDDTLTVTPPFERLDLTIPEDCIEEVGRVYGYKNVPSQLLPPLEGGASVNKKFAYTERIRAVLATHGYGEVYLYSLRDAGDIALRNSLASDKDHLRVNLSDGITEALDRNERNAPLLGLYDGVRLFEIGNVFTTEREETRVCVGVRVAGTKKKEARTHELLTVVKDALETELSALLPEPQEETLEFSLDDVVRDASDVAVYDTLPTVGATAYRAPSQYPFMLRDIAVWVPDGVTPEDILDVVTKHDSGLLVRSDLFDEFAKDGRVSYAFHLVFQSYEETLTDERIGSIMEAIEKDMHAQGWEVR